MAMFGFGLALLITAAYCWITSPTYRTQRAQRRTSRQQARNDRRYARQHRYNQ